MAKSLVTGATGFIGRHLVRHLRAEGDEVTCLVRPTSRREALEPLGVRFVEGDLTDPDSLVRAVADVERVYHLGAMLRAPWRPGFARTNADAVGHLARACAAADRPPTLVVVSTLAAGGVASEPRPRHEEDRPAPVSRYGRAKLLGELEAARLAHRVPITIVRPPAVLGGGDAVSLDLFRMAARGWTFAPTWRPHRMSVVFVEDLVDLLRRAADEGERLPARLGDEGSQEDDLTGEGIYYAAAEDPLTLPELARRAGALLGRPRVRTLRAPGAFTWCLGVLGEAWGRLRDRPTLLNLDKAREALAGDWWCTAEKARRQLGFEHADLDQRLAETLAAYQAEGALPGAAPRLATAL